MNTSEIFNPAQRKQRVVESFLTSHFGLKLAAYGDSVKVQTMIAKLVNENQRMASTVRGYENQDRYVKNTFIIEALKQILKEIGPARTKRKVNEQSGEELAQAELILVAKNMVEKLQGIAEDVAKMTTDELMPLAEKIKVSFGQDTGVQFNDSADAALQALLTSVKEAKDALSSSVGVLTGEAPAGGVAGMPGEITPGMSDMPDQGDDFGMADAASGNEELPMGRELK
jgi:lipopolysaccharide biosynthesis regulator YciM